MPEQELTRNSIMSISEDVGFDLDISPIIRLIETAASISGINALYHYAFSSIHGLRHDLTVLT